MSKLYRLLQIEYVSEYGFEMKKQYSGPYIFNAGGNLNKRWYIYYSFRNPQTGYLERQPYIDMGINQHKTVSERTKAARILQQSLKNLLENGFNPFNAEKEETNSVRVHNINKSVTEAIEFALEIAKKTMAETSYNDFKSRVSQFKEWLVNLNLGKSKMSDIEVEYILDFLNSILKRSSPRNRNNTRTSLASLYKIFVSNKIVTVNLIEDIDKLHAIPKKNKTYSLDQEEKILKLLKETDPVLDLFVKFISINLLRPIECCRLKIRDIELRDKVIRLQAKNHLVKTKIIPDILYKDLPDLSRYNLDDYLFTPTGPGKWNIGEVNKRNYFSERFKKIKDQLKLGNEYGLYSFRHTYITKLYRELRKEYAPFETKSRLMLITGHSSMDALEKYLRDIDAELPEDYSNLLKK